MALSKIKFANKKARREQKRRTKHAQFVKQAKALKIRNKRMRTMMIQGRREDMAKRAKATDYVKQLESELADEN